MNRIFKKSISILFSTTIASIGLAQTSAERAVMVKQYNGRQSLNLQKKQTEQQLQRNLRVAQYLQKNPNKKLQEIKNGVEYFIKDIRSNGTPIIINTKNKQSADVIKASSLYTSGSLGLGVEGHGITIGMWDAGKLRNTHELLNPLGKVVLSDTAATISNHSTHVAGTIVGADIANKPQARGIAHKATLKSYDWDNDMMEYTNFASSGYLVSNHSYGRENTNEPLWSFGAYDNTAVAVDSITSQYPYYLQCWAVGNEQTTNNNYFNKYGYDVITGECVAKNVLTVGAVDASGNMSNFSNWGPTDDGRIKPDIVAKGVAVTSCYGGSDVEYNTGDGTSYASPAIAGLAALIQQYYKQKNNNYLEAAGVKALLLHTATDLGNKGPDYKFGWGLANGEKAATTITNANANFNIANSEAKLATITTNPNVGEYTQYKVQAKGSEPLMVSVGWTDNAGAEQKEADGIDPSSSRLMYNFDITVIDTVANKIYYPWKGAGMGNVAQNATRATNNDVDNYKRVDVDTPVANRVYKVQISKRSGSPSTARQYTIVATGLVNSGLVLPIDNIIVTATETDDGVDVEWEVANEQNCKGYFVQASNDGVNFTNISFVNYANSNRKYLFKHKENTYNYYRINQQLLNNCYNLSVVIKKLKKYSNIASVVVFPNPVLSGKITITCTENLLNTKANIYNSSGVLIKQINIVSNGQTYTLTDLKSGWYVIKFNNGLIREFLIK